MAEPERLGWRKGSEEQVLEANAGEKLTEIVTWYDHMDDLDLDLDPAKLQIEEWLVAEVIKRLEEEISRPCFGGSGGDGGAGASWLADHPSKLVQLPPSSSSPSSAAFVTLSGNEESCGPSFSHSASTVMASIDTRGVPRLAIPAGPVDEMEGVWPWFLELAAEAAPLGDAAEVAAAASEGGGGGSATEGLPVEETEGSDDEWLARVLSGAGFEQEAER